MADTKQTAHTPTPWWVRLNPVNPDEGIVAAKPTEDHEDYGHTTTIGILEGQYPRRMADMKLIVRCVNSHEVLVQALKALLRFAENAYDSGCHEDGDLYKSEEMIAAIVSAESALKQAGGE